MAWFDLLSVGSDKTLLPGNPVALLQKVASLGVRMRWRELVLVGRGHGSLTGSVESAVPVATFHGLKRYVGLSRAGRVRRLSIIGTGRWRGGLRRGYRVGVRLLNRVRRGLWTTKSRRALLLLLMAHCVNDEERGAGNDPLAVCRDGDGRKKSGGDIEKKV